jgi:phage nucleotide-binding protein
MSKQIGKAEQSIGLKALLKPPELDRANSILIYGEGGIGKTDFCSYFPKPVFINAEDGTQVLTGRKDIMNFPLVKSSQDILDYIKLLGTEDHDYKTLVIDSLTAVNDLIESEVLESDGKGRTMATAHGGFGKAYAVSAQRHNEIKKYCEKLRQVKKMNIVFISHAVITNYQPVGEEPFNRYDIRLNDKYILPVYLEWFDCVGLLKLKTFYTGEEKTRRAISSGERVLSCHKVPDARTKTRFDITQELDVPKGSNPLVQYLGTEKEGVQI